MADTRHRKTYFCWSIMIIGFLSCLQFPLGLETYNIFPWKRVATTTLLIHPDTEAERFTAKLTNEDHIVSLYRNVCDTQNANIDILHPWKQFRSVVLVILFNNPLYDIVPLMEMLYRPFYPRIVYCISNYKKQKKLEKWNLTILFYKSSYGQAGTLNYICVDFVHQLGLKADGFVFMADDLLISLTAVENFTSQPVPALPHYLPKSCDIDHPASDCFEYGHFVHGANELTSLRRELKTKPEDSIGPRCDRAIQNITGFKVPFMSCLPDIFYIPAAYMQDASELFRMFHAHQVFHEVAILHVLACLTWPQVPSQILGKPMFGIVRDDFTKMVPYVLSKRHTFVHPFKLSPLVKRRERKYVHYFCRMVVPYLHGKFCNKRVGNRC